MITFLIEVRDRSSPLFLDPNFRIKRSNVPRRQG